MKKKITAPILKPTYMYKVYMYLTRNPETFLGPNDMTK